MTRPTKTQAIKAFLDASTHKDLADLYHYGMEVQVKAAQDKGKHIKGEFKGHQWDAYEDEAGNIWKSFRVPYNAKVKPEYEDTPIGYSLAEHAEGVGLTGWNWVDQTSHFFGFDFDAMTGHSDTHTRKLTDEELEHVKIVVENVPWVTLRRSTSGKGLHLYVFIDPTPTENHDAHSALARAILSKLSGLCGVDFRTKVDAMGHIMWFWHRKMVGTNGLTLIKQGCKLDEIPPHWEDHLSVIKGGSKKSKPWFVIGEEQVDMFSQMTSTRAYIERDAEHMKVCNKLEEIGGSWWNADHNMLVTHTAILKEVHESLQLRGPFDTVAVGRDRGHDHNCFCFPLRGGGWVVRRFSPGIAEKPAWDQDPNGWTRCFYNRPPDLKSACRAFDGKELTSGAYHFDLAEQAQKAAQALGVDLGLPGPLLFRKSTLRLHPKDGRLVATIDKEEGDTAAKEMKEWVAEKGHWKRIFTGKTQPPSEADSGGIDKEVRHIVSESGKDLGWVVYSDGQWRDEPLSHIKPALKSKGYKQTDVELIVGASIFRPWTIVCMPFDVQEPGDRQWNRYAPQFRFAPSRDDSLNYPTWLKLLRHCGRGLDSAIETNKWAQNNGITTGADYLKCWIASMFKCPFEPLPYLFFHSKEQDTGKSSFHEAIELLLTKGYVRADNALTSNGNFNGELEGALLCVIEETDLRKVPSAYSKIKDWVTSRQLPIHVKGKTPYHVKNTTHYVQCANSHLACPIFTGDTRITMIHVEPIPFDEMVPKRILLERLSKEAPDFLGALLEMDLPAPIDRLNIPVITTAEKTSTEESNETVLEMYIRDKCYFVTGKAILVSKFYDEFRMWIGENHPGQEHYWTKIRMGKEMPPQFPKGRHNGPQFHYGNIAFEPFKPGDPVLAKLALKGEYLRPKEGG